MEAEKERGDEVGEEKRGTGKTNTRMDKMLSGTS